jgi:hypothetical protein
MVRKSAAAMRARSSWPVGQREEWVLDEHRENVVYIGDAASLLSRAYDPLHDERLLSAFLKLGKHGASPSAVDSHPGLALQFTAEFGPLHAADLDARSPATVDIKEILREATHMYDVAVRHRDRGLNPDIIVWVIAQANAKLRKRNGRELARLGNDAVWVEWFDDLLAAVWLLFAQSLHDQASWNDCKNPRCDFLVQVPAEGRKREYHDGACKNRAHAARRAAEEKRLKSPGATLRKPKKKGAKR